MRLFGFLRGRRKMCHIQVAVKSVPVGHWQGLQPLEPRLLLSGSGYVDALINDNDSVDAGAASSTVLHSDFESDFDKWSQGIGDDFDWARETGPTTSWGTGPASASSGSYYIYLESSGSHYPNKTAYLISPMLDFSDASTATLSFGYHMYGQTIGELHVEAESRRSGSWTKLFSKSGQQHTSPSSPWKQATINLDSYAGQPEFKIRFRGFTGSYYTGDIAIDDVTVSTIVSAQPPVITLVGDANMALEASRNSEYVDLGATCASNVDGNLNHAVEVSGQVVNMRVPGTYTIQYNCSDLSGNSAQPVTRIVEVQDTLPPVISLSLDNIVIHVSDNTQTGLGGEGNVNESQPEATSETVVGNVYRLANPIYREHDLSYTQPDGSAVKSRQDWTIKSAANSVEVFLPTAMAWDRVDGSVEVIEAIYRIDLDGDGQTTLEPQVDFTQRSTYLFKYDAKDSSSHHAEQVVFALVLNDLEAPRINLAGGQAQVVEGASDWQMLQSTAHDNIDGDLTDQIRYTIQNTTTETELGSDLSYSQAAALIDTRTLGDFAVAATVSDAAGFYGRNSANNMTHSQQSVRVQDTLPPVITLVGDAAMTLEATREGNYVDDGATAHDSFDGVISQNVHVSGAVVNLAKEGVYEIHYDVVDSAGNAASTATRTVTVADTLPPVITLVGDENMTLEATQEDNYVDDGATAYDSFDGVISQNIHVSGAVVNLAREGVYEIHYDVVDSAGNAASTVTRTVTVADTLPPVITLVGDAAMTLEATRDDEYVDAGATCASNVDGNLNHAVEVSGQIVNMRIPDTYTIQYNCSDLSGNSAQSVTRAVTVADTLPPVITEFDDVVLFEGDYLHMTGVDLMSHVTDQLSMAGDIQLRIVNFDDIDSGFGLTIGMDHDSGQFASRSDNTLHMHPSTNFNGSVTVIIEARDSEGNISDGQFLNIIITPANTPLLGDANKDGQVTGADLIVVQQNFGNTGSDDGLLYGDANDDDQVTGADLIIVQQNFGNVSTTWSMDKVVEPSINPLLLGDWTLRSINGQLPQGTEQMSLSFSKTGRVNGFSGVNLFFGPVTWLGAKSVRFGPLAMTKMAGPEPLMKQEHFYMALLQEVDSVRVKMDPLELLIGSDVVLEYSRDQ